jgi:hypothetical protein
LDESCSIQFSSFPAKQLKRLYRKVESGVASAESGVFSACLCDEFRMTIHKQLPVCGVIFLEGRSAGAGNSSGSGSSSEVLMSLGLGIKLPGLPAQTVLPRSFRIEAEITGPGHASSKPVTVAAGSRCVDGTYVPKMIRCDALTPGRRGFKAWMVRERWANSDRRMWLTCSHDE